MTMTGPGGESKQDVVKEDNTKWDNEQLGALILVLVFFFMLMLGTCAMFLMQHQENTLRTLLADIRGPAGPAGPAGPRGEVGPRGDPGLPGILIDENGRATDAPSGYEKYVNKATSQDRETKFVFNEKNKKKKRRAYDEL